MRGRNQNVVRGMYVDLPARNTWGLIVNTRLAERKRRGHNMCRHTGSMFPVAELQSPS